MTTSDPRTAYVWVWLPGAAEPVVAGRIDAAGARHTFTYGRSYLARPDAISLYEPELPMRPGAQLPPDGMAIAGCLRDGGPDAWGQRVILAGRLGRLDSRSDTGDLPLLTYLLESGSDRVGGLDFQPSATDYAPRSDIASLEELQAAAERLEAGIPLSPALGAALVRGTSIGGARPKVLVRDGQRACLAKLASTTDPYPVVRAEAVGLELARRVGLDAPASRLIRSLGKDVLLIDRFDRADSGRRLVVSGLTMLGLDEMFGRYATYPDLADVLRRLGAAPEADVRELFERIVFNVCIGNTDDHARNHAAFWDGSRLRLTPAFDLCPQARSGGEAWQAMAYGRSGERVSRLSACIAVAGEYGLTRDQACRVVERTVGVIRDQWGHACDAVGLTTLDRELLWGRQILNPFIHEE